MKLVINRCYGGFGLSRKAFLRLRELGHPLALTEPDFGERQNEASSPRSDWDDSFCDHIARDDKLMVQVVEELGVDEASARLAKLGVVEIPDDVKWEIEYHDGRETVREVSQSWD